jgi:hypothetical protein
MDRQHRIHRIAPLPPVAARRRKNAAARRRVPRAGLRAGGDSIALSVAKAAVPAAAFRYAFARKPGANPAEGAR